MPRSWAIIIERPPGAVSAPIAIPENASQPTNPSTTRLRRGVLDRESTDGGAYDSSRQGTFRHLVGHSDPQTQPPCRSLSCNVQIALGTNAWIRRVRASLRAVVISVDTQSAEAEDVLSETLHCMTGLIGAPFRAHMIRAASHLPQAESANAILWHLRASDIPHSLHC